MGERGAGGEQNGSRPTAGEAGRRVAPPRGRPVTLPTAPDPFRYAIADLERETGVALRTIRFYITQGLLPPAHGRGPTASYDLGHLLRLRAIQHLKERYVPLGDIKTRLGEMSDDDIAAMFDVVTAPPEDRWRRIALHPDIELHVRERGGGGRNRTLDAAVEQLVKLAQVVVDPLGDPT